MSDKAKEKTGRLLREVVADDDRDPKKILDSTRRVPTPEESEEKKPEAPRVLNG